MTKVVEDFNKASGLNLSDDGQKGLEGKLFQKFETEEKAIEAMETLNRLNGSTNIAVVGWYDGNNDERVKKEGIGKPTVTVRKELAKHHNVFDRFAKIASDMSSSISK